MSCVDIYLADISLCYETCGLCRQIFLCAMRRQTHGLCGSFSLLLMDVRVDKAHELRITLPLCYQAQSQNEAGDYNSALSYGKLALACNIATFVYYAMAVIGGIIALVLLFAVAGISNNPDQP